jgi:hypothetical protein
MAIAASVLFNLSLCFVAMKLGSVFGFALAIAIANSLLTQGLGWYSCRKMNASWWRLSARNWVLALTACGLGIVVRIYLPMNSAAHAGAAATIYFGAVMLLASLLGIRINDLRQEWAIMRGMFGGR